MTQTVQRKPLTDKEQRVLVYAQLMGVEVASMSRIANRMRAQEQEQADINAVATVVSDYEWTVINGVHPNQVYEIQNKSTGWQWHCQGTGRGSSSWFNTGWQFEVTWTAPDGTVGRDTPVPSQPRDLRLRLLPERDRALYGLLRWLSHRDWNHVLRQHHAQQRQLKKKKTKA